MARWRSLLILRLHLARRPRPQAYISGRRATGVQLRSFLASVKTDDGATLAATTTAARHDASVGATPTQVV